MNSDVVNVNRQRCMSSGCLMMRDKIEMEKLLRRDRQQQPRCALDFLKTQVGNILEKAYLGKVISQIVIMRTNSLTF